ncbi:MAG: mechanosensitive ion channel family protein, partial [Pikeienuella sp.]
GITTLKREKVEAAAPARRPALEGWFALAEGGAFVLSAILLLKSWSIDPFDAGDARGVAAIAPALVAAACILIIGISAWRAAKAFIMAYEPAPEEEADDGGDGLGKVGSRIGTMLPVLRGFIAALIFSVTIMAAFGALGVNIGPMIAGAGIFGLAIGFGAQKLVADVISGFFYLYEDAFRVGEYIVSDQGKGVVENISIRSARLRHHRGALFTVPFSSMGTVQNHSRDWVKIKFTFQVAVDTDVEKVRKLVKKVGVQLMDDPELEGKFIEPVKSQGAVSIKGHSFEIGVKYMCKPGEQFTIRRKAYAALQTAFHDNGIELHRPSIMLDQALEGAATEPR